MNKLCADTLPIKENWKNYNYWYVSKCECELMFIIYHDRFVTTTPYVAKRYPVVLKCFTNHQNYPISAMYCCREWWFRYDLHPQLHLRIVPFWKVSSSYYPLSTRSSFESKGNPYSFAAVSWSKFRWSSCNWRLKSQTFPLQNVAPLGCLKKWTSRTLCTC